MEPLQRGLNANILRAGTDITDESFLYPAMAVISKVNLKGLRPKRTPIQKILHFFNKYFLLIGLVIVFFVSWNWPIGRNNGPLHPQITSSWMVTIILFFGIGLGLRSKYLRRACLFWQMNVFTLFMIFIYFPLIGLGIKQISLLLPEKMLSDTMTHLIDGIVILCCLPATSGSCVVFTSNARGNEAASAINCTLSNLFGIFLTPILILLLMENAGEIDAAGIFMKLSLRVIAPVLIAQMIRHWGGRKVRKKIKKKKGIICKIEEVALLYMVFCELSETFYHDIDIAPVDIVMFVAIIITLHCHSYVVIWYIAEAFRFCMRDNPNGINMYDRIAILYTGSSKTIALGIPLIETIYEGDSKLGLYLMPILLYEPFSLIVASILVDPFKKMVKKERENSYSLSTDRPQSNAFQTTTQNDTDNNHYGTSAAVPFMDHAQFMDHTQFTNIDLVNNDKNDKNDNYMPHSL